MKKVILIALGALIVGLFLFHRTDPPAPVYHPQYMDNRPQF